MSWGVGWGLTLAVMDPLSRLTGKPGGFDLFFATIAIAVGIAVEAITGYVLNVLLRHPISAAPEPGQEVHAG
jgi:hypothetical protein